MKKWIILLLVIVIGAIIGYNYIYQDHRDIESETAEYVISADEIALEFSNDATVAEQKFLNKTIEVSGTITEVNDSDMTLDDKVFGQFLNSSKRDVKLDTQVKIKGRVIGYDELLEQVKLDQCAIIK